MSDRMPNTMIIWTVLAVGMIRRAVNGQPQPPVETVDGCYGGGAIVTAVVVTLLVVTALVALLWYAWIRYWLPRKERHLILETDPERGKDEYAFDNPGFKDAMSSPTVAAATIAPPAATTTTTTTLVVDNVGGGKGNNGNNNRSRWSHWSQLGGVLPTLRSEKRRTMDDNEVKMGETVRIVALKSQDFTGLGFNICGNMKNGIYVKDLLHRGPASMSGKLNTGDRIKSLTINFEHMVFEDALTILSYASPYDVMVEIQGNNKTSETKSGAVFAQPKHPLYKSASSSDLLQINKSARKNLFAEEKASPNLTTSSPSNVTLERNKRRQQQQQQQEQEKATNGNITKFGVRVLPPVSPKSAELSQNDNNINTEKSVEGKSVKMAATSVSIDEVDKDNNSAASVLLVAPPVKRREKLYKSNNGQQEYNVATQQQQQQAMEERRRGGSHNNSGIRRDVNGIPQEIPSHMLNAAVAARNNRKSTTTTTMVGVVDQELPVAAAGSVEEEEEEGKVLLQSVKRSKGKAPSPPEDDGGVVEITVHQEQPVIQLEEVQQQKLLAEQQKPQQQQEVQQQQQEVQQQQEEEERKVQVEEDEREKQEQEEKTQPEEQQLSSNDNVTLVVEESCVGPTAEYKRTHSLENTNNTIQRQRLKKSSEFGKLSDAILMSRQQQSSSAEEEQPFVDVVTVGEMTNTPNSNSIAAVAVVTNEMVNEEIEKVEKEASDLKKDITRIEEALKQQNNNNNRQLVSNKIWPEECNKLDKEVVIYETRNRVMLEQQQMETEKKETSSTPSPPVATTVTTTTSVDMNISDDVKVSMNSLKMEDELVDLSRVNISSVTIVDQPTAEFSVTHYYNEEKQQPAAAEEELQSLPDLLIQNIKVTDDEELKPEQELDQKLMEDVVEEEFQEAVRNNNSEVTIAPTSLTYEQLYNDDDTSLTYITEIQVTPQQQQQESDDVVVMTKNLDNEFEQYLRNFESLVEVRDEEEVVVVEEQVREVESVVPEDTTSSNSSKELELQKLVKIQEIAEEQLKKLPEMRFSSASYEDGPTALRQQQHWQQRSQIELLRSTFERKMNVNGVRERESPPKSRIPVMKTSPERRDSAASEAQQLGVVTVTAIRSPPPVSRIPGGGGGGGGRPPVAPRTTTTTTSSSSSPEHHQAFKQWVFPPHHNVTHISLPAAPANNNTTSQQHL